MIRFNETITIRTEESYDIFSEETPSCGASIESFCYEGNETTQKIKQLIHQQKMKHFVSRTEPNFKDFNLRRFHSMSAKHYKRQMLKLPYHLDRMLHYNRKCPNLGTSDLLNTIYGAFYGFVIGDAIGAHMCHMESDNIMAIPSALLMNGGGTYNIGPAQGSDQTQMCFQTSYGLIEGKGIYSNNIISRHYLQWVESKPFNISAVFLIPMNCLKKRKIEQGRIDQQGLGKLLIQSSRRNKTQQSNLGLIRMLPIVIWSLKLSHHNFIHLINKQLQLITPNPFVRQTAYIYANILRTIIRTRDHQLAFYQAAKWVYSNGTEKIKELWRFIELEIEVPSKGNMGRLKTGFTYACIEINKKQVKFLQSLMNILRKGGQTDANCAIVMSFVGAVVGYNNIPSYFPHKISISRMTQSPRPRDEKYTLNKVIDIVEGLLKNQPEDKNYHY